MRFPKQANIPPGTYEQEWALYTRRNRQAQIDYRQRIAYLNQPPRPHRKTTPISTS